LRKKAFSWSCPEPTCIPPLLTRPSPLSDSSTIPNSFRLEQGDKIGDDMSICRKSNESPHQYGVEESLSREIVAHIMMQCLTRVLDMAIQLQHILTATNTLQHTLQHTMQHMSTPVVPLGVCSRALPSCENCNTRCNTHCNKHYNTHCITPCNTCFHSRALPSDKYRRVSKM